MTTFNVKPVSGWLRRVSGMLLGAAAIIAGAGLMGCEYGRPYVAADVPANAATRGRPALGMPAVIPGSDWLLVPFSMEQPQRAFEGRSSYGASASYMPESMGLFYIRPRSVQWHNVIFRHRGNGEERLLLDRRAVITHFIAPGERVPQDEPPRKPDFLLFGIADSDTNGDGFITELDAIRAYISDLDGRNLRSVTPAGTQFWEMGYNREDETVYFVVVSDQNGDKRFGTDDLLQVMQYRLSESGGAAVLITPGMVDRAEALLGK